MTKINDKNFTPSLLSGKRVLIESTSPRSFKLRLEALESRELLDAASILPATSYDVDLAPACVATLDETDSPIDLSNAVTGANWLVTSTADDGASGTLRYALEHANDGDTVTFADSLKGKTIMLNGSQLEIEKAITIDASGIYDSDAGKPGITIDADGKSRVIYTSTDIHLSGIEITNGTADKGAGLCVSIFEAEATFTNCAFSHNIATEYGGAVYFSGITVHATFTNCIIQDNTSTNEVGGGVCFDAKFSYGTFIGCSITGNTARLGGGFGLIDTSPSPSTESSGTFMNCVIKNNSSSGGGGGGVYISGNGEFTNCTIQGNSSQGSSNPFVLSSCSGAGVCIAGIGNFANCYFEDNSSNVGSGGGAYIGSNGDFIDCAFVNNTAGEGGGVYVGGKGDFRNCKIEGNLARIDSDSMDNNYGQGSIGSSFFDVNGDGGGILARICTVTNCVISNNNATNSGGGVYVKENGDYLNSVISNNKAGVSNDTKECFGGGLYVNQNGVFDNCLISNNTVEGNGNGGGLYFVKKATLRNCTVVNNKASNVGGVASKGTNYSTYIDVYNSIIVFNKNNNNETSEIQGIRSLNIANSISTPSEYWPHNELGPRKIYVYNAQEPLFTDAANSDYTLARDSQVINKGNNNYVKVETDLAGAPRIIDEIVDFGAYEYCNKQLSSPVLTTSQTSTTITLSWSTIENAFGYIVTCGDVEKTITAQETNYSFTGLIADTSYVVSIKALGDGNHYIDSEPTVITIETEPLPPLQEPTVSATPSTTSIELAWDAVEGATSYAVEYKEANASSNKTITVNVGTGVTIRNLAPGTSYNIRVIANDDNDRHTPSDQLTIKTLSQKLATPEVTTTQTPSSIAVTWTRVDHATGYKIACGNASLTTNAQTTSYTFIGLNHSAQYRISVAALGDGEHYIDSDQPVYIVETDPLPPLSSPTVTVTLSNVSIALQWSAVDGATTYAVEYAESNASEFTTISGITGTDYAISNLAPGTTYNIRVIANDDATNRRSEPAQLSATTLSQTLAPPTLTTFTTPTTIAATWLPVPNATGYALTCAETTQIVDAQTTTFTFANLTPATQYSISVKALGDGTKYLDSAPATAIVKTLDELGVQEGQAITLTVDVASDATVYWDFGDGVWRESGAVCVVDPTEYAFTPGRSTLRCRTASDAEPFYSVGIDVSEATPSINFEPVAIGNEQTAVYRIETNFAGRVAARDWRVDWGDGTSTVYSNQYSFVIGHVYATSTPESKRNIAIALLDASGSETYSATLVGASENAEIANAILDGAATVPTRLTPFVRDAFDQDWRNDELGGKSLPIDEILPEIESAKFTVRRVAFSEVDDWTAEETLDVDLGAF